MGRASAFGMGVLIPLLIAALQHLVVPHLNIAPFVLLFFGVTLASWLGGPGPGMISALLSAWLGNYFFFPPHNNFNFTGAQLQATLLFLLTASAIAWLTGSMRSQARQKDQLLAMLSHELRNPLAPVRNSLAVLQRAAPGSEQARKALAIIDRQTAHLSKLVDDLLDHTRLTYGKLQLARKPVEMNALVRSVGDDYRARFDAERLELEVHGVDGELWVVGDETRLVQAIGNLLSNAARFTAAGGRATMTLERTRGRATVRVRDNGIGIAPELQRRLFKPFTSGDVSLARSKAGLGLGLAVARSLVEMQGGTLTARSEGLGHGSEFILSLPAVASPIDGGKATAVDRDDYEESRHILIIEDSADAAESLRVILELHHHRVELAHSGEQGLAMARASRPEVILCDIGLPGMDGYAVARAIRSDQHLKGVFLVAVTGYALHDDRRRTAEAGFDLHLPKPLDPKLLHRILTHSLRLTARLEHVA